MTVPTGRPNGVRRNALHSERVRERIRTAMLLNRLTGFVLGRIEMSAHQVSAALGLLRKTVPDLAAIEHSGEVKLQRDVSANPLTPEAWDEQYGTDKLN